MFKSILLVIQLIASLTVSSTGNVKLSPLDEELSHEIGMSEELAKTLKLYSNHDGFQKLPEIEWSTQSFSGISINLTKEAADQLIKKQQRYLENGFLLFRSEINYGAGPDKVSVIKSADPYDIIRYNGTNGYNYDISPDDLIHKLKEWEERYPFHIVSASFDSIEVEFTNTETDLKELADEIYEFCPDVVDQGTGTVEELESEMVQSNGFYLWWD